MSILDRRNSLYKLEEQEADQPNTDPLGDQYEEVFEHLSVCIFFVDVMADGRFRYAGFNPAEEAAVGLTSDQIRGKYVEEVFSGELAEKLIGNYRRCVEAGKPITYDDELRLPNGSRHFRSNLIPLRNSLGRIHRIVGACTDLTDFKRAQEEAMSRQKLESLGVLAAGISHDFNNFLASILAETEAAQSDMDDGSPPIKAIQSIQTLALRASEIVRELMTYTGEDSAKREPTDLSLLVQEMLALLKISVSKGASLQVDLPGGLPPVLANGAQLRQVIMNLIINASEALGGRPGLISVAVTRANGRDRRPGQLPAEAEFLQLTISDTGSGMTPDVLSRIFDPFYTTKLSGRGLGLAAVQGIVRNHNGWIDVSSTAGKGTRFEILLPCMARRDACFARSG